MNTGERVGLFIAGYRETCSGYLVFNVREVFESVQDYDGTFRAPDDAASAAHDMARSAAESEYEYNEGWQDGRAAAEALNEARGALGDMVREAREDRAAFRAALVQARALARGSAQGFVPPRAWRDAMKEARELREARRARVEEAREEWAKAWDVAREAAPVALSRLESIYTDADGRASHKSQWTRGFAAGWVES